MKAYEEMLREFHDKYGQYRRPAAKPGLVPITVAMLRLRLMTEELGELALALMIDSRLQIADGLCDLAYVTIGTATTYGIGLPEIDLTDRAILPLGSDEYFLLLTKDLGLTAISVHEESIVKLTDCLANQLTATMILAQALNIPFDPCFREVHRSNMTKAVPTEVKPGEKYGTIGEGKKHWKGPDFQPPNLSILLGLVDG